MREAPVLRVFWVLGADRVLRISAAIALVVAMVWVVGNALPLSGGPATWIHDSGNYYAAGERLNVGHSLYAYGPGDRHTLELLFGLPSPYLYPPLIGVLFRPVAAVLPFDLVVVAFWASGLVTFLAFLGWLLWRGSGATAVGILILVVPLAETAWSGNVSTFITIGITLAGIALLRGARSWAAGAVIGFTTVLKLSPAFLGWWLLVTRRWSVLRVAIAVGAVSLAVSVLGAGIDAHFQFLSISSEVARQGGIQGSIVGILRGLFDAPPDLMPLVAPLVSVVGAVAVVLLRQRERAAWAVAIATGVLASPVFNLTNVTLLLAAFVAFDRVLIPSGSPAGSRRARVGSRPLIALARMDTLGRVARILAVAVVVGYSVLVMVDVVGSMPPDAVTYLAAGERLNAGHPLYSLSPGDRPITTDVPGISVPLLSPPGIAVVWRPLAALGEWTVIPWWILGSALFVIALSVVVWRAWPTIAIVVLVLEPIAWLVAFGNVHTYIAAGMVLLWFVRDRPWAAAASDGEHGGPEAHARPTRALDRPRSADVGPDPRDIRCVARGDSLVFAPGALAEYIDVMRTGSGGIVLAGPCRRARCDAGPASARRLCGRGRDDDARDDVRGHPLAGGPADRADPAWVFQVGGAWSTRTEPTGLTGASVLPSQ